MAKSNISRQQSGKSANPQASGKAVGRPATTEPLHELTLGRPPSRPPSVDLPPGMAASESGLDDLAIQCRRKADAARAVASRLRSIASSVVVGTDAEINAWADRLTDAVYFLKTGGEGGTANVAAVDVFAVALETLAAAVELVDEAEEGGRRGRLEQALPLMAEAQSAVRAAARALNLIEEPEQSRAFDWLKSTAARHRVFLPRFMRSDDPADPRAVRPCSRRSTPRLLATGRRSLLPGSIAPGPSPIEFVREPERPTIGRRSPRPWSTSSLKACRRVTATCANFCFPWSMICPMWTISVRDFAWHSARSTATSRPAPRNHLRATAPTPEVTAARRLLAGKTAVLIGGARRRDAERGAEGRLGARRSHLGRDERTSVGLNVRAGGRAAGSRCRFAGDPLGKPRVWRRQAILR